MHAAVHHQIMNPSQPWAAPTQCASINTAAMQLLQLPSTRGCSAVLYHGRACLGLVAARLPACCQVSQSLLCSACRQSSLR